jgi:hypothetical protein
MMGIITDIAGDKKKKKPFKHLKSAGTRWKTLEQPPTTTKTTFNGQTLSTITEMIVDLEIGDDLEVVVDLEIG